MGNMTVLATIDWLIILLFLAASVMIGILVKDKANEDGMEGFFVAGRDMKWWLLGTSIVATQFSADTPLVFTGWIAKYGIAGNWLVWSVAIAYVALTVFFARKWRISGVVTDTEISELRYGGNSATALRSTKAFVNAVILNPIILGWVFAAMAKISEPFMDWQFLLGPETYQFIINAFPSFLLFGSIDNSITIWLLIILTVFYSTLGGIRAVIVTDLFQFVIAIGMSFALSYLAVDYLGGLDAMWTQLATLYPSDGSAVDNAGNAFLPHDRVSAFIPSFGDDTIGSLGIPFSAFVLTLGVLWWTNSTSDGSGYIAQRLFTAKDGNQAEKGALWFVFANFVVRTWPWVIAGIAALVIYPRADVNQVAEDFTACLHDQSSCTQQIQDCLDNRYRCEIKEYGLLYKTEDVWLANNTSADAATKKVTVFKEDRERSYPAMIKDILPTGLIGLAVAALIAAIMSTISTHINWGASYVTNDFYRRFVNPKASDKKLTFVSRLSTIAIAIYSAYIATFIDNLGNIWILYAGMIAGMGLPQLMRWLWWRVNAWTEISGMLTSVVLALSNYFIGQIGGFSEGQISIFPTWMVTHDFHTISWIAIISSVVALAVTFLTNPVQESQLKVFVEKVRPTGFWGSYAHNCPDERSFGKSIFYWLLGTVSIYASMFGIGYLLRMEYMTGLSLLIFGVISLFFMVRGMGESQASC